MTESSVPVARTPVPPGLAVEDRGTHWKEGALILGIPAAIGMFLFSSASDDDSPDSAPLRDSLVAGLIAGAFGGLIGFFFPKK